MLALLTRKRQEHSSWIYFPRFFFFMSKGNEKKITDNYIGEKNKDMKWSWAHKPLWYPPGGIGGAATRGTVKARRCIPCHGVGELRGSGWKESIPTGWDGPFICQLFSNQFTGGKISDYVLESHLDSSVWCSHFHNLRTFLQFSLFHSSRINRSFICTASCSFRTSI